MSHYTVTLPVPNYIYDRARQIAEDTSQSIEAVLLQQLQDAFAEPLPDLPPEEQLANSSSSTVCPTTRPW